MRGLKSPYVQCLSEGWLGKAAAVAWKQFTTLWHAWYHSYASELGSIWNLPVLSESSYLDWPERVPPQLMQVDVVQLGLHKGLLVLFSLNLQRLNPVQFQVIFRTPTCPFEFLRTLDTPAVGAWRHNWKSLDVRNWTKYLERELHCYLNIALLCHCHLAQELWSIRNSSSNSRLRQRTIQGARPGVCWIPSLTWLHVYQKNIVPIS